MATKDAHPTAKAFFDALDQYNEEYQDSGSAGGDKNDVVPKMPSMSASLRRKSQSLGWRNRNSQSEYYPITIAILQSPASLKLKPCEDSASSQRKGERRVQSRKFSVKQIQRGEVSGMGTGATVWPAALVLVKYLERNNNYAIDRYGNDTDTSNGKTHKNFDDFSGVTLRGRHVIDLGGGTGVTSIAAALLGATSVVCTDGEESVVKLARNNIRLASKQLSSSCGSASEDKKIAEGIFDDASDSVTINGCPIRAQKYWWGDDTSRELRSLTKNNGIAILVADCVLPKLYPIAPLVQAIDECLRLQDEDNTNFEGQSPFAILSYEHRYYPEYDPRTEFRRLANEHSLDVFTVPQDDLDPVYSLDDVEVWIVYRRRR